MPWRELRFLGADKVISVVFENEVDDSCCKNLVDVAVRSFALMGKELSKHELSGTDYLIKIKSKKISLLDMSKMDYFYIFQLFILRKATEMSISFVIV